MHLNPLLLIHAKRWHTFKTKDVNRLKLNSIIINGLYLLSIAIYSMTFKYWETDKHLIYLLGKNISILIFSVSIVWMLINGIKILKTSKFEKRTKLKWSLVNLIPILIILIGTFLVTI